jgi:hypothetical protein
MKYSELKLGDLVEIEWLDAAGFVNEPLSRVKIAKARNIGYVAKLEKQFIALTTGIYLDDGSDPMVDATTIPRGWFESIKLLKRARKKKI